MLDGQAQLIAATAQIAIAVTPGMDLGGAAKRLSGVGNIREAMPEWLLAQIVSHAAHRRGDASSGHSLVRQRQADLVARLARAPQRARLPFDVREALLPDALIERFNRRARVGAHYDMSRPPPFPRLAE